MEGILFKVFQLFVRDEEVCHEQLAQRIYGEEAGPATLQGHHGQQGFHVGQGVNRRSLDLHDDVFLFLTWFVKNNKSFG